MSERQKPFGTYKVDREFARRQYSADPVPDRLMPAFDRAVAQGLLRQMGAEHADGDIGFKLTAKGRKAFKAMLAE